MLLRKITAIFDYLQRNQISHKNISIGSLFITSSKDIKLIGWSEPQKAWHISDFKDYLLLSLNVITLSCYEKLNDKLLLKH